MSGAAVTANYAFHGLGLRITSDHDALAAALQSRLRLLAVQPRIPCDFSYHYASVPDASSHVVTRPLERARPIYNPPVGEVLHSHATDQLYIECEDSLRMRADLRAGRVDISLLAEGAPVWLASHILFTLSLIELLKRRRRYSLHAAGLCVDGRCLVFPGTSGAGKSTLTVALLRAGFDFMSDDMLFLSPTEEGLRVQGFPDEIDLTDETAAFFPELRACLQEPKPSGWRKRPVWPEEVWDTTTVWEAPPAAVIFPRVAHADVSVLRRMDPDEAFLELVPNVLLTEVRSSQAHLDTLATLARDVPCYRLETGRDFDTLPARLRDLVRQAAVAA